MPGNHDVYVRAGEPSPAEYWGDYMRGDDGVQRFPFLRRRGGVALIALSAGLPSGPFMATGRLGDRQLSRFAQLLDQTSDAFRIVLIHHPPIGPLRRYLRRLTDAAALRGLLAAKGAELLLHGHDHRRAVVWLDGPRGKNSRRRRCRPPRHSAHGEEDEAGYNIFHIDGGRGTWRCEMTARQRHADGTIARNRAPKALIKFATPTAQRTRRDSVRYRR